MRQPLVYRGAKEICGAVGVSWKNMTYYVQEKGLPAFKIVEGGGWIALPDDLQAWIEEERDKELGKKRQS